MNLQRHLIRRFRRFAQIDENLSGSVCGTHASLHGSPFVRLANLCNLRNLRIEPGFPA